MSEKTNREIISTNDAPQAIGTYSQAVKTGSTVYLSGQIPLVPESMAIISDDISDQIHQVFKNLSAVATAADGLLPLCRTAKAASDADRFLPEPTNRASAVTRSA